MSGTTGISNRYYLNISTSDRGCGGTNSELLCQVRGGGVWYPGPTRVWNLGTDHYGGESHYIWHESSEGYMNDLDRIDIFFSGGSTDADWQFYAASVERWNWEPVPGSWHIDRILGIWVIDECINTRGWKVWPVTTFDKVPKSLARDPKAAYHVPPGDERATIEKAPNKNGSSRNSGEGLTDLEEEVVVVAEAVGHSLDDFDFVVDAFQQTGV